MSDDGDNEGLVLPRHLAVIMDGNGRWAKARGLSRARGHEEGADSIREITEECARLGGIEQLTLYALSYDNFHKRPRMEVRALFRLFRKYLRDELPTIMKNNIRVRTIGEIDEFPNSLRKQIAKVVSESSSNTGMVMCLALNYSARRELTHAAREIARAVADGQLSPDDIVSDDIERNLFTAGVPDVDLLIRTGAESRVSNFLLWQIAYSEIYTTDVMWPDFREENLVEAIRVYQQRERRFGLTSAQVRGGVSK